MLGGFLSSSTAVNDASQLRRIPICRASFLILLCMIGLLASCTAGPSGVRSELGGHVLIVGSTALQPLATAASTLFQKQHPQVSIEVRGGGSVSGLRAVTSQQSDIGNSDLYADPATYPDPNLTDHIICVTPFTIIVNPGVNIASLTQEQLIEIFATGAIRNWKQVGGPNLRVVPVLRPPTSGTRATFRKYVLGGRDEIATQLHPTDSSATVRDTVATTAGAIGYLASSFVDLTVHPVSINGVSAMPQNVEAGAYTFWSYEHMYTLGDSNSLLATFLDFMLTPTIQQLAQKLHYIPISNMNLPTLGSLASENSPSLIVFESEVARREY